MWFLPSWDEERRPARRQREDGRDDQQRASATPTAASGGAASDARQRPAARGVVPCSPCCSCPDDIRFGLHSEASEITAVVLLQGLLAWLPASLPALRLPRWRSPGVGRYRCPGCSACRRPRSPAASTRSANRVGMPSRSAMSFSDSTCAPAGTSACCRVLAQLQRPDVSHDRPAIRRRHLRRVVRHRAVAVASSR